MFDGIISAFKAVVIITIIIFVIIIIAGVAKSQEEVEKNREKERNRGVVTEADKEQILSRVGQNLLNFTMNQYKQAMNGDTSAMVALGAVYQSKLDNAYKAVYWYEKAHDAGDYEGTYWLGECYRTGYGVEENGVMAMHYIRQAAQHGYEYAIDYFKDRGMTKEQARQYGIPDEFF